MSDLLTGLLGSPYNFPTAPACWSRLGPALFGGQPAFRSRAGIQYGAGKIPCELSHAVEVLIVPVAPRLRRASGGGQHAEQSRLQGERQPGRSVLENRQKGCPETGAFR